ncbi:MAG: 50S ribosomal protein L11 methyltransferase [Methyloceanibacter sp.]|jgi:ribosomal protein L11 methyltransferase|nr:50S ribosomal protein L11 methyltransferase [Methyloceanibacter sp.]
MTHQASIEAPASPAMRIADALEEAIDPAPVAVGLFERGAGRFEVFAHYQAPPQRDALLSLIAQAAGGDGVGPLRIEAVPPADWVTLSQGQRGKVEAGRFLIHGSHDRTVARRLLAIEIDAGQAFGTAHHASTRGCLLALDDHLKRHRPRCIIDIGTGTGILAIAAAKTLGIKTLGAKTLRRRLIASDADPIAAATAAANARKNGVLSLIDVVAADGFAHPRLRLSKADLVLANLLEGALYALAPSLARHVAPAGAAILSGLTQTQARGIEARTRAHGFALEKRIVLDGWATLVIIRRSLRKVND